MTGYVQIQHEVWVPLLLARKDGTSPRIFCVFNTGAVPELVKQDGGPIDFRDYEDFVLVWAEQWAESSIDAMYQSLHPCTKTVTAANFEIEPSCTKTYTV